MTLDEIRALVAKGESETCEFKASTGARKEAAKTISAMLNQNGGCVLFGVKPNGEIVGQQVSDRSIEIAVAEFQRIDPPAFPQVERIPLSTELAVIAVQVGRGTSRPYQYKGVSYRRVGNTTQRIAAEEYNRMLLERMHSDQRWENQLAPGWGIGDLDIAEIRNTVAEAVRIGRLNEPGGREPSDLLRGLGLFRDGVLSRAAVVLFGSSERLEFDMPQCKLRVARFRGTDRSDFLDNRQFHGNAFSLLLHAERFLRDTLPIASRFESGRIQRIDEPLYPPLATREALANALCHRDYSIGGGSVGVAVYDDRLEITSTGPLHFGLTPEMLFGPHESIPWNPMIAGTFYRRGIIEEWGRGTTRMADMVIAAGLPRLEIEVRGDCVTVRFRRGEDSDFREFKDELTEQQSEILSLLSRTETDLALREIKSQLGGELYGERQIRRDLNTLKAMGLVKLTGHGRGARWKFTNAL